MTIVNVAKWGRAVYINIQKFVQFQLTVNVVALVLNFATACISGILNYEVGDLFYFLSFPPRRYCYIYFRQQQNYENFPHHFQDLLP